MCTPCASRYFQEECTTKVSKQTAISMGRRPCHQSLHRFSLVTKHHHVTSWKTFATLQCCSCNGFLECNNYWNIQVGNREMLPLMVKPTISQRHRKLQEVSRLSMHNFASLTPTHQCSKGSIDPRNQKPFATYHVSTARCTTYCQSTRTSVLKHGSTPSKKANHCCQ